MRNNWKFSLILAATSCGASAPAVSAPSASVAYTTRDIALPGASGAGIMMDYLAYDPKTGLVWAPAGNTGAVDVVDPGSGKVTQVAGFPTSELERHGRKRVVGPSSATVGDGMVYVGNRGDSTVCAFDERSFTKGACGTLDAMPDGIAYVAATNEVWVTTPRDQSVRILDGKTLAQKAKLSFEGEPEGFAVDGQRGRFYTNLEDKDRTLAIDVTSRQTVGNWAPGCGEDGPHGLALDAAAGYLFIACSTRAEVMDVGHDGKVLSSIDTGDGVDNLDYLAARHQLYVGAAKAAKLTVAAVDDKGQLSLVTQVPTKEGARNGVVTAEGVVFLAHTPGSELIAVSPAAR